MPPNQNGHLDDARIIEALMYQDNDLGFSVKEHLASCALCRQKKVRLAEKLDRLGQTAEWYAPATSRKVILPDHDRSWLGGWIWNRQHMFAAGMAALLIVLSFYTAGVLKTSTTGTNSLVSIETSMDEELIDQVYALEEDAFPSWQHVMLDESDMDMDDPDELIRLVIPVTETDLLSQSDRGMQPC